VEQPGAATLVDGRRKGRSCLTQTIGMSELYLSSGINGVELCLFLTFLVHHLYLHGILRMCWAQIRSQLAVISQPSQKRVGSDLLVLHLAYTPVMSRQSTMVV
jgi:hypothetical protein